MNSIGARVAPAHIYMYVPSTGDLTDFPSTESLNFSGCAYTLCTVVAKLTITVGTKRENTTILYTEEGEGKERGQ